MEADLGLVEEARAHAEEGIASAQASSQEIFAILSLGVLGRLELALGNLQAAAEYLRELPGRLLASGHHDPAQPIWADAIETLIALGELEQARTYLEHLRGERHASGRPPCRGRRRPLPRPARRRRGQPGRRVRSVRGLSLAAAAILPARAGPHAALSGHGAEAGAAEEGGARGAGAGARDLRGAGRAAVGGEGACGAAADQRPRSGVGGADRDRAACR